MVDQWMIENASEVNADENVDEQILAEQNYAEHVRAEDNDDVKEEEEEQVEKTEEEKVEETEEADTQDTEMKDGEDREDDDANDEAAGDEETSEYVPKRFVAQRETPDGPEILVEWEDWPDEKDWTWEPLNNLQEDAPDMMKAWRASRKAKKVSKVFEVESILGKRKIKGEWHYLVKWKGFSKDEAKSLEPCEKLAVDVPELVEAFENHKPKRGRPKRVAVS
jgi:Chromo (CHRromatin Organisation MOdifier) domain